MDMVKKIINPTNSQWFETSIQIKLALAYAANNIK
jgi:hypothetical protein